MNLLNLPESLQDLRLTHGFYDDFAWAITAHQWTSVLTDSGTFAVIDAVGGQVQLEASDGSVVDNDEAYAKSANETFLFAAGKPLVVEARVKFTEASTNKANILMGLMNAVAANSLIDDGGGPVASFSGACFYKIDGETTWTVRDSIATTATTTKLTAANSLTKLVYTAGGSWQNLRIEWTPRTSTLGDFVFSIDGVIVAKHKDEVYTSATEMQFALGVKNGGSSMETLLCDYAFAYQKR